jgi:uncharacterized protein
MDKVAKEFASVVRNRLHNNLKKIVLFGSRARGDHKKNSDYDILLLVKKRDKHSREIVLNASLEMLDKYDALFGTIMCNSVDWRRKKEFPIGLNIAKDGIDL